MNTPSKIQHGDNDLAFRMAVVGGSEVSALFGCNPWLTEFELWHRKSGTIDTPDFSATANENDRILAGLYMEPSIIKWACDKWGYQPLETPDRLDNGAGLGGHPDRIVQCPVRGRGLLEIKTADWLVAKQWGEEPPLHYQLQCLTYMGLAGVNWGDLIILVGGNELRRVQYQFRPVIFADIEARAAEFWQSVKDGKAPKPDYTRDGPTIDELFNDPNDTLIDLRGDNLAAIAAAEFQAAKADEKAAAKRADAAKAELMDKLGNNGAAMIDGFRISAPAVASSPDKEITADMIGTIIKGRKGYRRFTIKEIT